jgi:hypothetical protein
MPGKIENTIGDEKLRAIAHKPTGRQIQEVAAKHGVTVAIPAALHFRETAFAAHLQRLRRGRDLAQAITAGVREGESTALDAAQELASQELLDVLTDVDADGRPNIGKLSSTILNLRMADSSRKDTDRKLSETAAKLKLAEQRLEKLETDNAERREKVAAATAKLKAAAGKSADQVRADAVAEIDRIMGITPK